MDNTTFSHEDPAPWRRRHACVTARPDSDFDTAKACVAARLAAACRRGAPAAWALHPPGPAAARGVRGPSLLKRTLPLS